jgi:hypothetical protein
LRRRNCPWNILKAGSRKDRKAFAKTAKVLSLPEKADPGDRPTAEPIKGFARFAKTSAPFARTALDKSNLIPARIPVN